MRAAVLLAVLVSSGALACVTYPAGELAAVSTVAALPLEFRVVAAEVEGRVTRDAQIGKTEYVDGTELCWCWHAPVDAFSNDGYVSLLDVNRILGFKPSYNFGGFAYRNSCA